MSKYTQVLGTQQSCSENYNFFYSADIESKAISFQIFETYQHINSFNAQFSASFSVLGQTKKTYFLGNADKTCIKTKVDILCFLSTEKYMALCSKYSVLSCRSEILSACK